MERFFFRDFIARFDQQGSLLCDCGRVHCIKTRHTLVSAGAIEESVALLDTIYGSSARIWSLSDENTEAAAGGRWKAGLRTARVVSRILPARPRPVPTAELVERLAADVREESPDLLVAVGSGVISDLVKRVSLVAGIPNWCVATAGSVDAYSSATSAIRVGGFHGAVPARVSETIVCDLEVIRRAPREMFLAGLGDLLSKFLAHLDWNLGRIMTGESYCTLAAAIALGSARSALGAARMLRDDPAEAFRTLTDAALSSGFVMQATGSSRSAASAEHTMTHFWETTHAARNKRLDLHGILAGAASKMLLHVYRVLYDRLESFTVNDARRLKQFDAELPWQEAMENALLPYRGKVREEMAGGSLDRGILAQRLEAFRVGRTEILGLARPVLQELDSAVGTLEGMGCPFSLAELGIERELVMLPLRNARLLRRRYTGFDLAYELGLDGVLREEGEKYLAVTG